MHVGYTPRGPLNFKPDLYLPNGTTKKEPIFGAAGDISVQPIFFSTFNLDSAIMLPQLDLEANPRNLVTEIMHASTASEHVVAFRFSVDVGIKRIGREEFEWRKTKSDGVDTKSRYALVRLASASVASPSASSSSPLSLSATESHQTVAELVFANLTSLKHIFSLELKGAAGHTGELGER